MKSVGVAIVGFGTVGRSTAEILTSNAKLIQSRTGVCVEVRCICRRSAVTDAPPGACVVSDWRVAVRDPSVQVVVETIGGTDVARSVVSAALTAGKPVVTANKALLSANGDELFTLAEAKNVPLRFEGAVAGGIPVIRALTEGAVGDELAAVYGILNGTANYILSQMETARIDFDTALHQAQEAGYAERDPSLDIDGIDSRDKLAILTRLTFGTSVAPGNIRTTGIRQVRAIDMHYATRLNSTIRLIGAAERIGNAIDASVGPWLVERHSMLAKVDGAHNAIFLHGINLGTQVFYGKGAGGAPTGAAIVSDVVEIASDICDGTLSFNRVTGFGARATPFVPGTPQPSSWYLRLTVRDRPGILARVADIIAAEGINVDSVIQEPHMSKDDLSFVITVEPVAEPTIARAVTAINQLEFMQESVLLLRIA